MASYIPPPGPPHSDNLKKIPIIIGFIIGVAVGWFAHGFLNSTASSAPPAATAPRPG